jgi:hypothetical protein
LVLCNLVILPIAAPSSLQWLCSLLRRLISDDVFGAHFVSSAVVSIDKPDTQNHSESDKD